MTHFLKAKSQNFNIIMHFFIIMGKNTHLCLILLIIAINQCVVSGFNVETNDYTVYKGHENSLFGFSVAGYRDQYHHGMVIVGAPYNQSVDPEIERGGAVYRCDISQDNACIPIEFDKKGLNYVKSSKSPRGIEPIDTKNDQWLGATISTSMVDGGFLLACAPKYHWYGYIKANWTVAGLKDAVGTCWLTNLYNSTSTEYSPCRNNDTAGHHKQGMCQAGFSAALTKDGSKIFIGAPGSWYWQGQLFTIDSNVTLPFVPTKETNNRISITGKKSSLLSTKEGPPNEDNNYLGYSVAIGDFLNDGDNGVAVGLPRSAELHGKVMLLTSKLHNHKNITGEQMGAYFGYALAVNDVDGDKTDDIIITAPFFTQYEQNSVKIETGRIYVFYQRGGATSFQKFHVRDGEFNRGQFGLAIASAGDINLDGYGDIIVGEPYGGLENRGAVYIYHGSEEGIKEKASQVIYSESLEQPIRTFGWSVNGGLDLDNNGYPDIVVGAYESSMATFFRSRPVMNIIAEVNFETESISLDNKVCILSDGTPVSCNRIKVCCMYTGSGSPIQQAFSISVTLDGKKKRNPRLYFVDYETQSNSNYTTEMYKDRQYCRSFKVYLASNIRDKLTSLDADIDVKLLEENEPKNARRNPRSVLKPIFDPITTKKRDSLTIQKNCGSDGVCIPDLKLHVIKTVEKYLLSSSEQLELKVTIENRGEDAFESMFYLQLPRDGMDYVNIINKENSAGTIIQCSPPKTGNNQTLRCDIGNPFPKNQIISFNVLLQPKPYHGMSSKYDLHVNVNSSNHEAPANLNDNIADVTIPIWIDNDVSIYGASKPQEVDFNSPEYVNAGYDLMQDNVLTFGPVITHNYTIRNNGPSIVSSVATTLMWTAQTSTGDIALYLADQPQVSSDKIRCDPANADYLNIQDTRKIRTPVEGDKMSFNLNSIPDSRNKRALDEQSILNQQMYGEDDCEAECVHWTCVMGPIQVNEEISIAAKYRMNMKPLTEDTKKKDMKVSTKLVASIMLQPFIGETTERIMKSFEVETVIRPLKEAPKKEGVALWIIIVAAVAGILILSLLIFLLYKCGFFKRNRPSNMTSENEPLRG